MPGIAAKSRVTLFQRAGCSGWRQPGSIRILNGTVESAAAELQGFTIPYEGQVKLKINIRCCHINGFNQSFEFAVLITGMTGHRNIGHQRAAGWQTYFGSIDAGVF